MKVHEHIPDNGRAGSPVLLKREALADRYSVTPRTIAEWQACGFLPHVKLAKKCVRFPVAKCDAIIERLMRGGNGGGHA